jgi:exosortase/archaeosortase family protein
MKPKNFGALKSALLFLVKLNILAIPLYSIVHFGYTIPELQNIWATALAQSLESFGYETALDGYIIGVQNGNAIQNIELSWDSTGWKSLYALTALVFASSGAIRGKLRFLAFGLPLIIFVNFLRIDTTILFSLAYGFNYFEFIHGFLWGALMIIFVLALWYFVYFKEKDNKR